MTNNLDPHHMTLEERSFFGLEPAAHVVVWRERERLARIKRQCQAMARASGAIHRVSHAALQTACAGYRAADAARP